MAKKKNKKELGLQGAISTEVETAASLSSELVSDTAGSGVTDINASTMTEKNSAGVEKLHGADSSNFSDESTGTTEGGVAADVTYPANPVSDANDANKLSERSSLEANRDASDELPGDSVKSMDTTTEEAAANTAVDASSAHNSLLVTDRTQIKQVLEAIIFAAPKAMTIIRLRNLLNHFNYDSSQMTEILAEMINETEDRGFQLIKIAGGYQFRTHPEHSEVLQKLLEDKPARLSTSALEVLAIVAYKQPVSRSDIDSVRGVDSGHLMKGLLEKNLVRTLGHAETPGRPLLYGTTSYFLEVFSLGSLDDLPEMDEINRELSPTTNGEEATPSGELDLGLDGGVVIDSSGLSAEPNRGTFDQPLEEEVHAADFGLNDRAREEVESSLSSEAQ